MKLKWAFTSAKKVLFLVNIDKWGILPPVFQNQNDFAAAFKTLGCTFTDDIIVVKKNYMSGSVFWVFYRYTFILANFDPFFVILLAKKCQYLGYNRLDIKEPNIF